MSQRTYKEQFEHDDAEKIRLLIERATALRRAAPGGATKYYLYELSCALEVGLLLASLHLASTSLELFLRAKASTSLSTVRNVRGRRKAELSYQQRLEESRKIGFADLLKYLSQAGLFRQEDIEVASRFYADVRTPLAHGLLDRFIHGRPKVIDDPFMFMLRSMGGFTGQESLERSLDVKALEHIDTALSVIERNASFRVVENC